MLRRRVSLRALKFAAVVSYLVLCLYALTNSHPRVHYLSAEEVLQEALATLLPIERNATHWCLPSLDALEHLATHVSLEYIHASVRGRLRARSSAGDIKNAAAGDTGASGPDGQGGTTVPDVQEVLARVERHHAHVAKGGAWKPGGCKSIQRVAIVIPHRGRFAHLVTLLDRLHTLLYMQHIEYK